MNKVELVGRLTRDPEVRATDKQTSVARFSVAVNRRFKNAEGNYDADFISCIAFGKTAEFIEKYFKKGMAIGVVGRIQTGSYENKDGVRVYTTDVVVDEAEFVEGKNNSSGGNATPTENQAGFDDFGVVGGDIDEELPFN